MDEIWKDIPGWERFYQVSNWGRVKSLARFDTLGRLVYERIRKLTPHTEGYVKVSFTNAKIKKRKYCYVHELVAQAFIGLRPEGMEINHIDGIKTNNRLDNLEYVTRQENIDHAIQLGLINPTNNVTLGEKHWKAKLTNEQVLAIREARINGTKVKDLAKQYGVTRETITNVTKGHNWKHI